MAKRENTKYLAKISLGLTLNFLRMYYEGVFLNSVKKTESMRSQDQPSKGQTLKYCLPFYKIMTLFMTQ